MYFYHYFSKKRGPFRSISDLPIEEARKIWNRMIDYLEERNGLDYQREENILIARRHEIRRIIEDDIRQKFAQKGGRIDREYPYYMRLSNDELPNQGNLDFYEDGDYIKIPAEKFDTSAVSFTYCDSMQYLDASSYQDGMYQNKVYTFEEIRRIIDEFGWEHDFGQGKPHLIEAQLWSDTQIAPYRNS